MIDQSEILEAANEPGLNVSGYLVWLFSLIFFSPA